MALSWWAAFLLLVVALGWRMTPPRGDNWAGCAGMVAGLWLWRQGLVQVAMASLISGFVGGFGFSTATMLKLIEVKSGWQTNGHSILEQTYGFINGTGIAASMYWLSSRAPGTNEWPPVRRWTEPYAVSFVLLGITWLSFSKNPAAWVKAKAVPETLSGLPAQLWFHFAYLCFAVVLVAALVPQLRRPLPVLSASWLGRGQIFYLVFLWWMIIGNFERALVSFSAQQLVTEGVIHFNGALCTLLVLCGARDQPMHIRSPVADLRGLVKKAALVGIASALLTVTGNWAVVRAVYGNQFAGHAGLHIRFGPNATATKEKPPPGQPHP